MYSNMMFVQIYHSVITKWIIYNIILKLRNNHFSASQSFVTCFENIPQRCLEGHEEFVQSVEMHRNVLNGMCGFINGGEGETTTPPEAGKKRNMTW